MRLRARLDELSEDRVEGEEQDKRTIGLGQCAVDNAYERGRVVFQLLEWGSPTLAYAVAKGYNLAPLKIPIQGTFPDSLTVSIDQATAKDKLVQDVIVDRISWHLDNLNTPVSVFDAQSNTFFEKNSGIEAQFQIVGAPRYPIANRFTPVTEIAGDTPGWILSLTNGMTVQFHARFPLPETPMAATLTLHCRTARWEKILRMDDETAIKRLTELGYDCSAFEDRYCMSLQAKKQ